MIAYENGSIEARDKLIEHNLRLVVFLAKKYENTNIDLYSIFYHQRFFLSTFYSWIAFPSIIKTKLSMEGMEVIGERLLELRKDADLTQDDLALILNINKHSISSYERDKSEPPDSIKIAIAKYFNVSIDYLLGVTDVPVPLDQQRLSIRLPKNFPQNKLPELMNYAEYLAYKEKIKWYKVKQRKASPYFIQNKLPFASIK